MIGPIVHIPRTKLTCIRCDYYKERLLRSGRPAIWEGECNHPMKGKFGWWPMGGTQVTPEWCPELPHNKNKCGGRIVKEEQ